MRADFGKVVIERPRRGHGNPNKPTRGKLKPRQIAEAYEEEYEDGGARRPMSMGSHPAYGPKMARFEKDFSDLIGPLNNLLHNRIGRSLNSVRSELASVLGGKSEPERHVLTVHFEGYFPRNIYNYRNRFSGTYEPAGFYEDAQGRIQWRKRKPYVPSPEKVAENQKRTEEYALDARLREERRHKPESCEKCKTALREHNAREKAKALSASSKVGRRPFKPDNVSSSLTADTISQSSNG